MTTGIQPKETEFPPEGTLVEFSQQLMLPMITVSVDRIGESTEARRQVESYCQSLVDTGTAQWRVNDDGDTELHIDSGEAYLLGELGVTRLR
jgi:hypothetical protein